MSNHATQGMDGGELVLRGDRNYAPERTRHRYRQWRDGNLKATFTCFTPPRLKRLSEEQSSEIFFLTHLMVNLNEVTRDRRTQDINLTLNVSSKAQWLPLPATIVAPPRLEK